MATATSYTQEAIDEKTNGWTTVAEQQEAMGQLIASILTRLETVNEDNNELHTVILPQLQEDLANGSYKVSDLVNAVIPDLKTQLEQHGINLANLNTIDIPRLDQMLGSNSTAISDLNTTILPELNTRLDALEQDSGSGFDPTEINNKIAAIEGKFPISAPDILADTITANEIASQTITALEIAGRTITANEIATDAITANEIAAKTITAAEIASRTITALEILADTITANEIATDAITANEIAAKTITAAEIAARAITAAEIKVDTITANEIAANAITTSEIAANAVTANEINAGAVTTEKIFAGAVTAEKVSSQIIVANEVYGRDGYFGQINADQVVSGTVTADLGILGSLSVGEITMDPTQGLIIPSPIGDTVFPADGVTPAEIAAAVRTRDLEVNGGLTVNGETNNVNGSLYLTNVVQAPKIGPRMNTVHKYSSPIGVDSYSLSDSHDGAEWLTIKWDTNSVYRYRKSNGSLAGTMMTLSGVTYYGVTRCQEYYFAVGIRASDNKWVVYRASTTGTGLTTFYVVGDVVGNNIPGLGVDQTNNALMVAYCNSSTTIRVISFSMNATVLTNDVYTTPGSGGILAVCSTGRGPVGPNNEDSIWVVCGSVMHVLSRTTKALSWTPWRMEGIKGVAKTYDGKLVYLGFDTYRVYEYATQSNWSTNDVVQYAWYDSDIAGSGKHETTLSPESSWTNKAFNLKWCWMRVTTQAPADTGDPDSPDSVAIYINKKRQPDIGVGVISIDYASYNINGAAPKTTNEFISAAAYPGELVSEGTFVNGVDPKFRVRGDGTGNWGDLVVDGNGKATLGGDTGWIEQTAFGTGWENYPGTTYETVGYRKIGPIVYLKGMVSSGSPATAIFNLPVGFRPLWNQLQSGIINAMSKATGPASGGTAHTHSMPMTNFGGRVNISTNGNVGVGDTSFATGYISLDGISFFAG